MEKLLAEGKPIPPTAAQQGQVQGTVTVRRWSAMAATRRRFEPCGDTGECPVVPAVVKKSKAAPATDPEQAAA